MVFMYCSCWVCDSLLVFFSVLKEWVIVLGLLVFIVVEKCMFLIVLFLLVVWLLIVLVLCSLVSVFLYLLVLMNWFVLVSGMLIFLWMFFWVDVWLKLKLVLGVLFRDRVRVLIVMVIMVFKVFNLFFCKVKMCCFFG